MINVKIVLEINEQEIVLTREELRELGNIIGELTNTGSSSYGSTHIRTIGNEFTKIKSDDIQPIDGIRYQGGTANPKVEDARKRAQERTGGCGTGDNLNMTPEYIQKHRDEMQKRIQEDREKLFEVSKRYQKRAESTVKNMTDTIKVNSCKPSGSGGKCCG